MVDSGSVCTGVKWESGSGVDGGGEEVEVVEEAMVVTDS